MTHELMHYAFGLADQYPKPAGIEDGDAECINETHDISLMNRPPFYADGRWQFTELDRNATDTPCDHGTVDWSWPQLRRRYEKVPAPAPNIPLGHDDRLPVGNADGRGLEIWILDHSVGGGATKLTRYVPEA